MSRLIDADALKEEIEFQQEHMFPEDLSRRLPRTIDNAPTIPAIPVEWLEAQKTEYFDDWGEEPVSVEAALRIWQKEQEAQDG